MRALVLASLIFFAAGDALAQYGVSGNATQPGQRAGEPTRGQRRQRPELPPAPPPPPLVCADLTIHYAGPANIDAAQPLAADEIALRWEVRNSGNAAYDAHDLAQQALVLEYTTPGGPHEVAVAALPPLPAGGAVSDSDRQLAPAAMWRGIIRATLPPEAQRRPLRLKIRYTALRYGAVNDCNVENNTEAVIREMLTRPSATP